MRISPETIYRSLYVQSRGELRRQLTKQLRTGREKRKRQGQLERRGHIPDMVAISQPPPEVEDRAVPGHWEGDLLVGARNQSFVVTLVERHTRYVMLAGLGRDRRTERVIAALRTQIQTLPSHLTRSLTWDQGHELAAHKTFSVQTGVDVYFADPHSPCSADLTRTPTAYSGSTSPKAATSPASPSHSSTRSPASSTAVPARRSTG